MSMPLTIRAHSTGRSRRVPTTTARPRTTEQEQFDERLHPKAKRILASRCHVDAFDDRRQIGGRRGIFRGLPKPGPPQNQNRDKKKPPFWGGRGGGNTLTQPSRRGPRRRRGA